MYCQLEVIDFLKILKQNSMIMYSFNSKWYHSVINPAPFTTILISLSRLQHSPRHQTRKKSGSSHGSQHASGTCTPRRRGTTAGVGGVGRRLLEVADMLSADTCPVHALVVREQLSSRVEDDVRAL